LNVGSIQNWNPQPWLDVANILTAYDEPLLALKVLDMVPGFYRDNIDPQINQLRDKILEMLVTPKWYSGCHDVIMDKGSAAGNIHFTLRGRQVLKDITELNQQGLIPKLIELAPGQFWLPIGLWELGCKFEYQYINLNEKASDEFDRDHRFNYVANGPTIFCAFEIIEHLHFESDIKIDLARLKVRPDIIHLSTPLYSFDGRASSLDWTNKDLGHLRTYTPNEFAQVAMNMFRGYSWNLIPEQVMHLRGSLNGN